MPLAPAKQKFIDIDFEVANVLREQLDFNGNNVKIVGERLDPKLYKRVNAVLAEFGGKWTAGKTQAHVFPTSPRKAIDEALGAGKVLDKKRSYQFFETPADVADLLVKMTGISGKTVDVLEPSAGNGALIAAIFRVESLIGFSLDAVDIDHDRCAYVREHFITRNVFQQDFLEFSGGPYDAIIMNPPFTGGQDASHVMHAFELLKPGGRLGAIIGEGICTRTDKKAIKFHSFVQEHVVNEEKLEQGTFKSSGTMSASRIIVLQK